MNYNYVKGIIFSFLITTILSQYEYPDLSQGNAIKFIQDLMTCQMVKEPNISSCISINPRLTNSGPFENKCCYFYFKQTGKDGLKSEEFPNTCYNVFADEYKRNSLLYEIMKLDGQNEEIKYDCGEGNHTFNQSDYDPYSTEAQTMYEMYECLNVKNKNDCFQTTKEFNTNAQCCWMAEKNEGEYCRGIKEVSEEYSKELPNYLSSIYESTVEFSCKNKNNELFTGYVDPKKKSLTITYNEQYSNTNYIKKSLIGLFLFIRLLF